MGAGCVVAPGRNEAALADLARRFGPRVRSGLLDLRQWQVAEFGLDGANEAVAHAAGNAGPFRLTVLRP